MLIQRSESINTFFFIFFSNFLFVFSSRYVDLLINNSYLVQYIDVILKDERISLNDPIILNFAEIYYSKVCFPF